MTTTAYPLPIHRGCGHTTQQHHTLDGLEADLRNAERTIAELTDDVRIERTKAQMLTTTVDRLRAELADAQELIAELRNNRERDDRALARYDTRQEQAADLGSPAARAQDQVQP